MRESCHTSNRSRRPHSSRDRCDDGFTLIEMMIAMTLITTVMIGFAGLFTGSLTQVGFARQRQVANRLVTQTIEQARALSYSAIQAGLDVGEVSTTVDPNVSAIGGGVYRFVATGENLVAGTHAGTTPAPLSPYRRAAVINSTNYRVSTYLTYYQGSATAYRLTVIASWSSPLVRGVPTQVSSETVLTSSTTGCLSPQTHPFASPCQAFLYGQATSGSGQINILPGSGAGNAIAGPNGAEGVPLVNAELNLTKADSSMQGEQVTALRSSAATSRASLNRIGLPASSGGDTADASATDDASASQYSAETASQFGSLGLSAYGSGPAANGLIITAGDQDEGIAMGTAVAKATPAPACIDLAAIAQLTGLPCASATVQQRNSAASPAMAASLVLSAGSSPVSMGTTQLAAVGAAPNATASFVRRSLAPSAVYCPTATGDGCVHAGGARSIGTVTLGGLPTALLAAAPPGWGSGAGNYLIQMTGYSDAVHSESGLGTAAGQPTVAQSGTLRYWNGTGYTSTPISWGASPPTLPTIPAVALSTTFNGQPVRVTITTHSFRAGGTRRLTTGSLPCATSCQASAHVNSPFTAELTYVVTVAEQVVADLRLSVNLGELSAQTRYQAAPSA